MDMKGIRRSHSEADQAAIVHLTNSWPACEGSANTELNNWNGTILQGPKESPLLVFWARSLQVSKTPLF